MISRRAFTLIELLTVVAIIGILATILVPTLGSARTSANKARTRTQFSTWAAAFESFRQEYGSYPQLYPQGAQHLVNQNASTTATQEHLFFDTLTGRKRDPTGTWRTITTRTPPLPEAQNTRRIQFVSFTDSDLVTAADVTAGYNTNAQLNFIRDGFHNTSIAVVTDANLDGVINGRDSTGGYPAVTVSGGTLTIRPLTTDLPTTTTGGIHAGVVFYSAPPGASTGSDLIMSWK
jgi:prepilin-type N-terminal cleavage/methylation domain-containing protein